MTDSGKGLWTIKSISTVLEDNNLTPAHLSPYLAKAYPLWSEFFYRFQIPERRPPPSKHELILMRIFRANGLEFEFERPIVLLEDSESFSPEQELHIRYPDFYVPRLGVFLEYDGSEKGRASGRYAHKANEYRKNAVAVSHALPEHLVDLLNKIASGRSKYRI